MLKSVLLVMKHLQLAGTERYTINLAEKLASEGISVTLVAGDGPYRRYLRKNIKTYIAPVGREPDQKAIAEKVVLKAAAVARPQIIHAQCRNSLICSQLARKKLNIPTICIEHISYNEYEFPLVSLELNTYADAIITVTSKIASDLVQHNVPPSKITTIFNGVNVAHFSLPKEEEKKMARKKLKLDLYDKVILSLSRIVPGKKIEKIIEAFPAVLERVPKAKLIIVGYDESGETKPKIINQIKTLGFEKKIFVFPATYDVRGYYAAADVFCHPSRSKGMSVMEAMASGLPVVGKAPVTPPIVAQDQISGLLLRTDKAKELADKIILLLQNRELAIQMGRMGRMRVERLFTLERCVNETKQAYVKTIQHVRLYEKKENILFLRVPLPAPQFSSE